MWSRGGGSGAAGTADVTGTGAARPEYEGGLGLLKDRAVSPADVTTLVVRDVETRVASESLFLVTSACSGAPDPLSQAGSAIGIRDPPPPPPTCAVSM